MKIRIQNSVKNMLNTAKKVKKITNTAKGIFLLSLFALPVAVQAAMPATPTAGGKDGLMAKIWEYIKDPVTYGSLLLSILAFIWVAAHAITAFNNAASGKTGWSTFAVTVVVGVLMIVVAIYLLNQALDIL